MHTLDNADRPYLDILPCVDHVSRQSQNHLHDQLSSAWVSEAALCGTLLILFCHFWKHLWLFWHNSRNEKQAINPCNLKKYSITSLPRGFTQIFYRGRRGDVRQRLIFYTPKKSQLQSLSTQKNPCVFSMPKTVLHQCSVNCYYVIVDLSWWKVLTNPKKTLRFFSRPQKIPASFIDPKLPFWPKFQTPPPPPPSVNMRVGPLGSLPCWSDTTTTTTTTTIIIIIIIFIYTWFAVLKWFTSFETKNNILSVGNTRWSETIYTMFKSQLLNGFLSIIQTFLALLTLGLMDWTTHVICTIMQEKLEY